MTAQNFSEGRKAQIVNSLREAQAKQSPPVKPKSEAELESDRSAAAVALNSVFLKEMKSRYGNVERKITTADVAAVALSDAVKSARARQAAQTIGLMGFAIRVDPGLISFDSALFRHDPAQRKNPPMCSTIDGPEL
jgi:hypothetical protein